jgi:hypothetical protein
VYRSVCKEVSAATRVYDGSFLTSPGKWRRRDGVRSTQLPHRLPASYFLSLCAALGRTPTANHSRRPLKLPPLEAALSTRNTRARKTGDAISQRPAQSVSPSSAADSVLTLNRCPQIVVPLPSRTPRADCLWVHRPTVAARPTHTYSFCPVPSPGSVQTRRRQLSAHRHCSHRIAKHDLLKTLPLIRLHT